MDLQTFDHIVAKYLSEGITQKEKSALDNAIENDLFYLDRFEQMKNLWRDADSVHAFSEAEKNKNAEFDQFWNRVQPVTPNRFQKLISNHLKISNVAAAAAIVFVVISSVLLHYNVAGFGRWIAYSTKDNIETIWLPDSSCVTLNKFSRIVYLKSTDYGRKVRFNGEAFFDVAHDSLLPFIIHAAKTDIRVVGTKFNLNVDKVNGTTDLLVTEGVVVMASDDNEVFVQIGEQGSYKNGKIIKKKVYDRNKLFWQTGVLTYTNSTLDKVVDVLMKNYKEIKSVKKQYTPTDIKITTRFENQSLKDIFEELELHFEKKFELKNNILIISD